MPPKSQETKLREAVLDKAKEILSNRDKTTTLEKQEVLKMLSDQVELGYADSMATNNTRDWREMVKLYAELSGWLEQHKITIPKLVFNLSFAEKPKEITEKIAEKIEVKEIEE